ncbi:MAG: hypothetical protein ABH849_02420 [Nanoarchaeota archaeon]
MTKAKILYVADSYKWIETFEIQMMGFLADETASYRTTNTRELADKLREDPNYSFVIMHLSCGGDEGVYRIANDCRSLTNAVFIAESGMYNLGQKEILKHFDEYKDAGHQDSYVKNLLIKYGFIRE